MRAFHNSGVRVSQHDLLFALLCLLNVNMGALDSLAVVDRDNTALDAFQAHTLVHELAMVRTNQIIRPLPKAKS
jgi:hypothetical protein